MIRLGIGVRLAVIVPVLLGGPVLAQGLAPGALELSPGVVEHEGETYAVQFGTLRVPSYRPDPASPLIRLRFVRYLSPSPEPGPPLVFLAGGPGGSGVATMGTPRGRLFRSFLPDRDVIGFDQRGTGVSEPALPGLQFAEPLPLDEPGDADASCEGARRSARAMLAMMGEAGVDPRALTTEQSADDLASLAAALDVDQLVLWGSSYGTHLALATARRHPGRVAAMILAGTAGPDYTLKLPSNIHANLVRLSELVRRDPVYAERMPDLVATVTSLLDDLERNPRTVTPLPGYTVTVGRWDLQKAIASQMGSRGGMQTIPARVHAMAHGEFFDLARWAIRHRRPRSDSAMGVVMDCASYATADRLRRIDEEARQLPLGAAIDFPFPCVCEVDGMPRLDDDFRAPLRSEVPTLFISGTLDGRTPPSNAEEVAAGCSDHQHLVIENAAHGSELFLTPGVEPAVRAFLRGERIGPTIIPGPRWEFSPPYERSLPAAILYMLAHGGFEATAERYRELREAHEGRYVYDFRPRVLDEVGHALLGAGMIDLAVDVFRLNTVAWPDVPEPWLGLATARLEQGDLEGAAASCERVLALDPENRYAAEMLTGLSGDIP